eukprot:279545-Amorphochlora_amoeboformis.AAC.1
MTSFSILTSDSSSPTAKSHNPSITGPDRTSKPKPSLCLIIQISLALAALYATNLTLKSHNPSNKNSNLGKPEGEKASPR